MATQAQIEANRRNARHSTGPKTAEGKAAAARNAVTHGFAAVGTLLNHEDPQVFGAMLARYITEWRPQNEHEAWLVRQMAEARWRLERMRRIETAVLNLWVTGTGAGGTPEERIAGILIAKADDPLRTIERYAAAAERSFYKALRELNRHREAASAKLQNEPEPASAEPALPDNETAEMQNEPKPETRALRATTFLQNEPDFTAPYAPFARAEAPPPYMTK